MAGLFGKKPSAPKAVAAPQPAPQQIAPQGTTPDDYRRQQSAYWQNLLSGMGQGTEGGGLPTGIQANIDRQASLLQ